MRLRTFACFASTLLSITGIVTAARADGTPNEPVPAPSPSAAPVSAPPTTGEAPQPKKDDDDRFRSVTLTANPLSLLLGRIGLNVEYLPTTHHAIVANPYFSSASAGSDNDKTSYTTFGGELGYHFYSGERGANGFFIGPSLIFATVNASSKTTLNGKTNESDGNITAYGVALDLGGQHVTKGGFTIGGGVGAMYLASKGSSGQTSTTVKFEGVLPRFLLTIGYSF